MTPLGVTHCGSLFGSWHRPTLFRFIPWCELSYSGCQQLWPYYV